MSEVTKLFPVFAVRDLQEAIDYYCNSLGFSLGWTWGVPPMRAGVSLNKIEIQLDAADMGAPSGSSVVYCHMTGVDEYYVACCERGANITLELEDRPWGMKDFRTVDPSGNRVGFGEVL